MLKILDMHIGWEWKTDESFQEKSMILKIFPTRLFDDVSEIVLQEICLH
jgi:hypothetical protein